MRINRIGLPLCVGIAAVAQDDGGNVGGARWLAATRDEVNTMYFRTRLEPAVPGLGLGVTNSVQVGSPGQDSIRRLLYDRERKIFFGYDVRIDALENDSFRVTFARLPTPADVLRNMKTDLAAWRMLDLPQYPARR